MSFYAEASVAEEPGAEKPHAGIRAGGVERSGPYCDKRKIRMKYGSRISTKIFRRNQPCRFK
jgi:hypothetical protein